MGKLVLNVGTTNNDKTGDTLRAGGLKIKANFEEIYQALASDGVNISGGNLLKTGDYSDLRNKPNFSTVAVSGSFFDLEARPDIGIFVGAPPNNEGSEGHVAGNLAFDGNNLYVCREDYVTQAQFTNFVFEHEEDFVDFSLQARFSNTTNHISLTADITKPAPSVDWFVTDGTVTRNITMVSEEMDGATKYYLCELDGPFVSAATLYYEVGFSVPTGHYVFCAQWKPEYQALLDAHDEGQGSKLYVTYDGYGRTIHQIIHDSIENEITISYSAGSKIADYDGIIVKLDQPKIWKSIPWAPVYADPFPGGGSGSTGDVTFTGTTITGTGNTLTLKADSTADYGLELFNSIDNDTHLRPLQRGKGVAIGFGYGMGSHIRVEGTDGQGGVPNSGDRVGIFAMDTDTGNSAEWVFDNDGSLTFPDSSVQTTALIQGQHLFLMDEVNIEATFTEVNFSLLLATPAIGYTGSDTHTIVLPNGAPGQRFAVVNNSSLCTVEIGPHAIPPVGRAEFVFTDGPYGDGWIPLYGTV